MLSAPRQMTILTGSAVLLLRAAALVLDSPLAPRRRERAMRRRSATLYFTPCAGGDVDPCRRHNFVEEVRR